MDDSASTLGSAVVTDLSVDAALLEKVLQNRLVSNNDGTTFVVRAGTTFELLAQNEFGERITASPAISGDELIYRTDSHLYCIGQNR